MSDVLAMQEHMVATTAKAVRCANCDGTGRDPEDPGHVEWDYVDREHVRDFVQDSCPECRGEGELVKCRAPGCDYLMDFYEATKSNDTCEEHAS